MTLKKMQRRSLFMAIAFCCCSLLSQAQPGDPGGDPGPDPDPGPTQSIPFDGGISLVVAAGIAYAAKKGYDKRKKTDNPSNS